MKFVPTLCWAFCALVVLRDVSAGELFLGAIVNAAQNILGRPSFVTRLALQQQEQSAQIAELQKQLAAKWPASTAVVTEKVTETKNQPPPVVKSTLTLTSTETVMPSIKTEVVTETVTVYYLNPSSPATSTTTRVVLITELPVQQEPIEGTNDLIDSSKPLPLESTATAAQNVVPSVADGPTIIGGQED